MNTALTVTVINPMFPQAIAVSTENLGHIRVPASVILEIEVLLNFRAIVSRGILTTCTGGRGHLVCILILEILVLNLIDRN